MQIIKVDIGNTYDKISFKCTYNTSVYMAYHFPFEFYHYTNA
jgi:hypothetical protein